jgi:hypothetical protein
MQENTMSIQAHIDPLPLVFEPHWRQPVARSVQDHRDVSGADKPEVGRDAFPSWSHQGAVVGASAWLAFYVVAAATIAFGN